MRPSHILARATVVASAVLLSACAGRDITAPDLTASSGTHALAPGDATREVTADGVPIIRIGVVQSASTITLGSAAEYEVKEKGTASTLLSGQSGAVTVRLASVAKAFDRLQVICTGLPSRAQSLVAQAQALGFVAMTDPIPGGCIRVYYGELPGGSSADVRNAFSQQLAANGLLSTGSWKTIASGSATVYEVSNGSTKVQTDNPVTIASSDGIVTINGLRYRGIGEARVNSAGALAGVNALPLEQYLYGVVPRELGPIQYPEVEAQKAQAIVARTYAIAGLGKRGSDGYDLRATTDDQVYGGYAAEHPVSTQAVDETRGRVVTYGGNLISTLYSSTSGGHTADNEEAFTGNPVPYLRGVPDAERGNAFEHVPSLAVFMSHANPKSLRAAAEGDFESDWASYHRWTFEWTSDEISSIVSAWAGKDVGRVQQINVLERGPSGRALRLEYVTDAGSFYATKDGIRAALRYLNANNLPTNLPSTLFYVEPVTDRKTKAVTGFVVYGGGFGHGVGMSQTGAVGMAQKGHSVDEILQHYYQGTELATQY